MKLLRQNTQTIIDVGPILGTDFLTVQTGAALAAAHAELFQAGAPPSHRHVTDLYLLGLAVKRGGRLATFDRAIPLAKVRAEAETLALIPA